MKTHGRLIVGSLVLPLLLLSGCERPPIDTIQHGYRGTGMVRVDNPRIEEIQRIVNTVPAPIPALPSDPNAPTAGQTYQNVQVLGDLSSGEFTRLMLAITNWVAPQQGCVYCHAADNFADDSKYTKTVARQMLTMTRHINADWQKHVAATGVTCYTCHRGKPVPENVWYKDNSAAHALAYSGNRAGQNEAAPLVGLTALPKDPFSRYFSDAQEVRVQSNEALPMNNRLNIMDTEATYGAMMYISQALGENCTFCHNSQSFKDWSHSTVQRVTAWHGIRMVRELNNTVLDPLKGVLPANRLGPLGDAPKLSCTTCHQGVNKPLYGVSMLKDYPALGPAAASVSASAAP
jgi:photosynthetic reaction center cytochrome c subunit